MLIHLTDNIKNLKELENVSIIPILYNGNMISTILIEDFNKHFTIVKSTELTLGVTVILEYVTKELNLNIASGLNTDISYILYNDEITSYDTKNNYVLDLSYYKDRLLDEESIKGINFKTLGKTNKKDRYYIVNTIPYIETSLKLKYNKQKALTVNLDTIQSTIINDDFYSNYNSEYLNDEVHKLYKEIDELLKDSKDNLTDFNHIDYSEFVTINKYLVKNDTLSMFIGEQSNIICLIDNVIYTDLNIDKETLLLNHIDTIITLLDTGVKNNISTSLFNKLFKENNSVESKTIKEYSNTSEESLLAVENLFKQSNTNIYSIRLKSLEESLIEKYKEIEDLQSKLTLTHKSISRLVKEKEYTIDGLKKKETEDYKVKAIVNHPHFDGIYKTYNKNDIAIKLKDMYFVYNDVKFKLPEDLYIYITDNDILIGCEPKQLTIGFTGESIPAPHVITPKHKVNLIRLTDNKEVSSIKLFGCCWGETYANEIIKLAINKDYLDILEYIVVWLKQVNIADQAGKLYSNWSQMK